MLYTNANLFVPWVGFVPGGFTVEDGRFREVFFEEREGGVDLQGAKVLPGLVHHQLPQGCKDYSEYYLKMKTPLPHLGGEKL